MVLGIVKGATIEKPAEAITVGILKLDIVTGVKETRKVRGAEAGKRPRKESVHIRYILIGRMISEMKNRQFRRLTITGTARSLSAGQRRDTAVATAVSTQL